MCICIRYRSERGAFRDLTTVNISSSVKRIEKEAFWGTKWYDSLTNQNNIVGDGVFMGFFDDASLIDGVATIPEGVKYIYMP